MFLFFLGPRRRPLTQPRFFLGGVWFSDPGSPIGVAVMETVGTTVEGVSDSLVEGERSTETSDVARFGS